MRDRSSKPFAASLLIRTPRARRLVTQDSAMDAKTLLRNGRRPAAQRFGGSEHRGPSLAKPSLRRSLLLPLAVLAVNALGACSSQQMYGAGQAWQRNECFKINDQQERDRCLASAAISYEQYKHEVQARGRDK